MSILDWFKRKLCRHYFRAADMQHRDADGIVRWPCSKCGKVFEAECGLDILHHGECDGLWGETHEKGGA